MSIHHVAVIGGGQMGAGIAQVVASKGCSVTVYDNSKTSLVTCETAIKSSCDRLVKKEKLSLEEKGQLLSKLRLTDHLKDLSSCELVIEAVTENYSVKEALWRELNSVVEKKAVFASNTSSISITRLASASGRPEKFAGMHFMNPVPLMPLVEGIRGLQTSDETFGHIRGFAEFLGKIFIEVKDRPGFAVNRILLPMINEAIFALYEGVASPEDIDNAMKLGTNQPMGPLALADFIGLDTCLNIMRVLHEGLGEDKYRPCPLLVKHVEAGWLGRKTLRGFYHYNP